jgi:hypothetical protein
VAALGTGARTERTGRTVTERCLCGGEMWERTASNGGGLACSLCHPDPRVLRAEWIAAGRPSYNVWLAQGRRRAWAERRAA